MGVFGIDDRPQARPHVRVNAAAAAGSSFTPVQVAEAYAFPSGATGKGQNVGIVELGGGFSTDDLTTYFPGIGPDRAERHRDLGGRRPELPRH